MRRVVLIVFLLSLCSPPLCAESNRKIDYKRVIIDKSIRMIKFILMWQDKRISPKDFHFQLQSPSGKIYDRQTHGKNFQIIGVGGALAIGYKIIHSESGTWTVIIDRPKGIKYYLSTTGQSILKFRWDFVNHMLKAADRLIVEATLMDPDPVTNATVEAILKKYPKGSTKAIEYSFSLNDSALGDDKKSGDGIYTGTFFDTQEEGSYCLDITATGTSEKWGEFERHFSHCTVISQEY